MAMHRFQPLFLGALFLFAVAGVASAHAVVYPREVKANTYEKFALRVPTEKDVPTVKVRLEVPEGFTVSRVQPLPGWKYEFEQNAAGAVRAITWSGGEIGPTEFQEFVFQAKAPKEAGKFAMKAWQTYKDGIVVEWTGPSDAKTPASFVAVLPSSVETDSHGTEKPAAAPAASGAAAGGGAAPGPAAPASTPAPVAGGGLTAVAAYGGLGLGALALVLALRRR